MRLLISLGVLVGCIVLVLLAAAKTAQTTPLAARPDSAAELRLSTQSGSGGGSGDDNGSPIEGRRIYMRENCYICHGGFVGGGMCPSLRHSRPGVDDVREVVRNGTPNGMPPFPELNEQDVRNLCAYFQSLRTEREPTFTHWWEPVPTQ
jgi:mono/diheme cytochrome c family protein